MKLLTVEQAAERLGVGVRFVRRLIAERRIRIHKIGKHVRIAEADIDAFIARGRIDPTNEPPEPRARRQLRPSGPEQRQAEDEAGDAGDWTAEAS